MKEHMKTWGNMCSMQQAISFCKSFRIEIIIDLKSYKTQREDFPNTLPMGSPRANIFPRCLCQSPPFSLSPSCLRVICRCCAPSPQTLQCVFPKTGHSLPWPQCNCQNQESHADAVLFLNPQTHGSFTNYLLTLQQLCFSGCSVTWCISLHLVSSIPEQSSVRATDPPLLTQRCCFQY